MTQSASILPLVVHELSFVAENKRLLKGVSFELPGGGITALIGPNGAGKSLTLRLCHGLLVPSSGHVRWLGHGQRRHAMVFQRPVMLRRSVKANIKHALAATGATGASGQMKAALERFGLAHLAERPARLLSGGEQQRLAIARAWVLQPEVLFLDEPTAQLDPGATRQIEALITVLANEGMTILMTTHDLAQARRLSQRVLFLHQGRLLEDIATDMFFNSPATPEARAFVSGELLW
jgi:tungstate transport system ATP-binding protein